MQGVFFLQTDDSENSQDKKLLEILFPGKNARVVHHTAFASMPSEGNVSEFTPEKGSFVLGNSAPERDDMYEMAIPSKASSVCTWYSGEFTNCDDVNNFTGFHDAKIASPGYSPTKLLLRLNSVKHDEDTKYAPNNEEQSNYLNLVKSRIYDHLNGLFTFTTAFYSIGPRSRIIIGNSYKDIFFFFVSIEHTRALVWTDRQSTVYDALRAHKFFIYGMTPMSTNSIMVIHPQYTISKWRKWKSGHKDTLACAATLETYLQRKTLHIQR